MNTRRFRSASRKQIGAGVSSTVDLCESKVEGFTFVIKRYFGRESFESKKEYHERVLAEYYTIKSLKHCNIIEAYQFKILFGGGSVDMYMEAGIGDFGQLFRANYFSSEDQLLKFWHQLYDGVYFLHNSAKLCHRDLKLSNLVLAKNGTTLKIIDFLTASNIDKPATGLVGTSAYAAPETFLKISYDGGKADVWAIGIILVYFISRKFPWKAASHDDVNFVSFQKKKASFADTQDHILQDETNNNDSFKDVHSSSVDDGVLHSVDADSSDTAELNGLFIGSLTRFLTLSLDPGLGVNLTASPVVYLMLESDPDVRSSILGIQTHPWFQMLPES